MVDAFVQIADARAPRHVAVECSRNDARRGGRLILDDCPPGTAQASRRCGRRQAALHGRRSRATCGGAVAVAARMHCRRPCSTMAPPALPILKTQPAFRSAFRVRRPLARTPHACLSARYSLAKPPRRRATGGCISSGRCTWRRLFALVATAWLILFGLAAGAHAGRPGPLRRRGVRPGGAGAVGDRASRSRHCWPRRPSPRKKIAARSSCCC